MSEPWKFDLPPNVAKNEALAAELYREAMRRTPLGGYFPSPPLCRRITSRIRYWWYTHRPTFHFGPCDHSECE